jgi:Arc/MetJ-type ribon-helix-helix transcriptional regulator
MEPITFTAIVAALSAGVATGAGKVVEKALVDAYKGLKATLKGKFGDDSEVVDAVDKLEQKPGSEARKALLQEELEAAGADEDDEIRQAAEKVRGLIKAQAGGEQHIQHAVGSYLAQADHGSTATVNVDRSRERSEI